MPWSLPVGLSGLNIILEAPQTELEEEPPLEKETNTAEHFAFGFDLISTYKHTHTIENKNTDTKQRKNIKQTHLAPLISEIAQALKRGALNVLERERLEGNIPSP